MTHLSSKRSLWASGEPFIWLTGGALALALMMVVGLVFLVLYNGLGFFWPADMVRLTLKDGTVLAGQITAREKIPQPDAEKGTRERHRIQIKQGNRDIYGIDFRWVNEDDIVQRETPADLVVIERKSWGNFHGTLKAFQDGAEVRAAGPAETLAALRAQMPEVEKLDDRIRELEKSEIGRINANQERIRLRLKKLAMRGIRDGKEVEQLKSEMDEWKGRYKEKEEELSKLRSKLTTTLTVLAPGGEERTIKTGDVVRVYQPNSMGFFSKAGFYLAKVWEFVADDPRESNTEGGVFPAIFGTVLMVVIMSIVVTPMGVLAALYLREYARQGRMVSIVRIAVNNLAGVPSIVFGVFGVGFFIYFVGGSIDALFYPEFAPSPKFGTGGILWASLTLALLTVPVVIVATEEGLAALPNGIREASMALGATKFETTWRVVLPAVTPSILTGLILAMARAAGEVAPLMITGVVKLAPSLAVDGTWPHVHLDRKFMHLGFHIYDVGFQSPNVDAARPMVYTTTVLLLLIVLLLNLTAIWLRNHLRKKHVSSNL